ncbi:beta-lactamase family protein [Glaciecola sp. XM2]|jgi:CubicO group peptidase (beta-lactamase class C family)|uniref:serine hydrolase domain-containing protein n=1 Tax=Glaciecola sp. XM2 TaxID=1914931 RepID=UPI001BDF06D7|nr:serine hydrolase domain-containing protein [Glaciecola sp. XM2]MBT1450314.1 beta-lactamase family protein [Glaciecola sp. XM2]
MRLAFICSVLLVLGSTSSLYAAGDDYFPASGQWESKPASEFGMDQALLDDAIAFAQSNEYSGSKDLRIAILKGFEREPFHEILGPTRKRGGPTGLILKNGYIVGQWGEPSRVDMTFSVTKSYLTTVAGLAVDKGLIAKTDDLVSEYVWTGEFDGRHNSQVSWEHLLNQSSDWSGELFGIKDWADRPPAEGDLDDWKYRELRTPGSVMEYNDVRVNLLAYSLLNVFRQPLPQVLKEHIMDPIGASTTWRWYGYDHAWVTIDGKKMQSVTGGGHSGAGIFVNTFDQARFGLLFERDGRWNEQQLISKSWIKAALTPSPAYESYGYMWWLNKGPRKWEQVDDESLFYAAGFGGNFIVIDREHDVVIVTRWLEPSQIGEFVKRVRSAL